MLGLRFELGLRVRVNVRIRVRVPTWGDIRPVPTLGRFFVPVSALGRCHDGG